MNNNIVEDEDLIYNTSKRVPICICVNASAMENEKAHISNVLSEVKKGIDGLYSKIEESDMIRDCAEVSIISFDNTATVIQDYTCYSKYNQENVLTIKDTNNGFSDLGSGINCALDLLQARKQLYNAHGVGYSKPWLIVITDTKPITKENKKSISAAAKKTLTLEKQNKITTITINVSGETINVDGVKKKDKVINLSKSIEPHVTNKSKLTDLFDWLGNSIDTLAFENEIKLDFSGLTDWEDI